MSRRKAIHIVWAGIIIVAALIVYQYLTDPTFHHGSSIELGFEPLSKMLVESDQPITLQVSGDHPFLFVNTDDGSVLQGAVVSTAIQNVTGEMSFRAGPQVISEGHWQLVNASEADSSLQLVITGDSEMGVTTYPDHVTPEFFVFTFGLLFGVVGAVLIEVALRSLEEREASEVPRKTKTTLKPAK